MSSPAPPGSTPYIVFVAILLLVLFRLARRVIANYRGTRFSLARTVIFGLIYVLLGTAFSLLSFLEGVPSLLAIPEVLLAVVAAFLSYRYTDRRVSFWRKPDGTVFFKGGIVIYLIYTFGLVARFSIEVILIGPSMFDFSSVATLEGSALYGSMAADLILLFGVGLLVGRGLRVARRYRRIQRGEESVPSAPSTEVATTTLRLQRPPSEGGRCSDRSRSRAA